MQYLGDNATNEQLVLAYLQECLNALNEAREDLREIFEASRGHWPELNYFVPPVWPVCSKLVQSQDTSRNTAE